LKTPLPSVLLPEVQAGRVECGALIQDGGQRLVVEHVVTHQQAQQGFGQLPPAVVPHLPDNNSKKLIYYLFMYGSYYIRESLKVLFSEMDMVKSRFIQYVVIKE
jgi:hypothetical protein